MLSYLAAHPATRVRRLMLDNMAARDAEREGGVDVSMLQVRTEYGLETAISRRKRLMRVVLVLVTCLEHKVFGRDCTAVLYCTSALLQLLSTIQTRSMFCFHTNPQEAVSRIDGRIRTEASGNVTLETVRRIAATGVDFISSGALTHSVKAMDISLKIVTGV